MRPLANTFVVALLLALAGCCGRTDVAEDEPVILDWNLSNLPFALLATGWLPANEISDWTVIGNVGEVSFKLDDADFYAKGDIHDVTVTSWGRYIEIVQVDHVPMTVEEAAETLRELDLPVPDDVIVEWVASAEGTSGQATPKFPEIELDQRGYTHVAVGVTTRYSFDEERPVVVSAVFVWSQRIWEQLEFESPPD